MRLPSRSGCWALLVFAALQPSACSGRNGHGDGDDDDAADGDADADADADADGTVCLDATGDPTDSCALDPERQPCSLSETDDCSPQTLVEVWADDGSRGACLHVVFDNDCGDTLYSWTCIEHTDPPSEEPDWQCWLSTTLPGFDVDLSQCNATGRYAHYGSLSDGTLDIIDATCNPRP